MNKTSQVTDRWYEDALITFGKARMFSLKLNVITDPYSQGC
jgi:hypothetical protein